MEKELISQTVIKSDGNKAAFSDDKLRRSLLKAGAPAGVVNGIIARVKENIHPGITTREIYDLAFELLRGHSRPVAARYHLKHAILELGPSGFPFEQFISELFRHKRFIVQTNMIVSGFCVKHEVDVLAIKLPETHYIECKYHQAGIRCDIKIALYVHARFKDIMHKKTVNGTVDASTGWLITNTRFSSDAMQYGECAGLRLMSWDYPAGAGLKDLIDEAGLYPITCLTSLSHQEKSRLLHLQAVLCRDLIDKPVSLSAAGIPEGRRKLVLEEAESLSGVLRGHAG